jgi:hypothetical protein
MYVRFLLVASLVAVWAGCATFGREAGGEQKLAENAGYLELTVNARNAQVWTGDTLRGMIKKANKPQRIAVPAGTHQLLVKKLGYKDFSAKVAVEAGAVNTLEIQLERIPPQVVTLPEEKPQAK